MQTSSQPKLLPVPFANGGSRQDIPNDSQIGITAGRASYIDGFPPLTRTPLAAGGVPPFGTDFNGVLNDITAAVRWAQAGAGYPFDPTFNTAITGYPKGARIPNSTLDGFWLNTTDGNTTNPENTTSALTGWVPSGFYGVTAINGLSGSSVTLSTLQAGRDRITLAGTLTANINLVVPAWSKRWEVVNNCSGSFSVTVKTPNGTGVAVPAGMTAALISNGTNVSLDNSTQNVSTQVTGTIGQSRNLVANVSSASTSATITADEIIVATGLGGSQYRIGNFSKTINIGTTGAGGMDTGAAPSTGFVAIYAIYNPLSGASALLAANATSSLASEVYSGSNMPPGYTASALVSVWRTASSQLTVGYQFGRSVSFPRQSILSTSTAQTNPVALSVPTYLPFNAKSCNVDGAVNSSASGSGGMSFCSSSSGIAWKAVAGYTTTGVGVTGQGINIPVITPQTIYYTVQVGSGTLSFISYIHQYEF